MFFFTKHFNIFDLFVIFSFKHYKFITQNKNIKNFWKQNKTIPIIF